MPKNNWKNNNIQFPRLIAELQVTGAFTPEIINKLSEEMDLEIKAIEELIDRACNEWDKIKSNIK